MDDKRAHFRPEFLNSLDETILFKHQTKDNIGGIIHLIIADLKRRLEEKQQTIRMSEEAMQYIVVYAYDPVYGARPLRRLLKNQIENKLAMKILNGEIGENDTADIIVANGQLDVVKNKR